MKKIILITILSFTVSYIFSQNRGYAISCLKQLSSKQFHGRGFTHNGDKIAAKFIVSELKKIKAKSIKKSYYQYFNININTFPDSIFLEIPLANKLKVGKDFLIDPISGSLDTTLDIIYLDTNKRQDYTNKCVVIDKKKLTSFSTNDFMYLKYYNPLKATMYINIEDNELMHEQSTEERPWVWVNLKRNKLDTTAKKVKIKVKNKFIRNYTTQNIVAKIKGKSDSIVMFIAHYDHLGEEGQALFPGLNDNGSGISTLLDLAHYFSKNKPKYTTVFLFAGAEEVGLLGSKYFAEHPLFNLKKAKYIINLDVIGSGEKGIAIVNGKKLSNITNKIKSINKEHNYFKHIKIRDNVPNADHYFFAVKNLPAVFIYTEGNYLAYHSVYDKNFNLIFPKYNEFFNLILELVEN